MSLQYHSLVQGGSASHLTGRPVGASSWVDLSSASVEHGSSGSGDEDLGKEGCWKKLQLW